MFYRLVDIVFSVVLILLTFPIQGLLFFVLLFDIGNPIFVQERIGFRMKPFKLIKFRSMVIGTNSVGTHKVDPNAITTIGRWMRKTKLDELPQLFNVVLGQMSLVGPRPNLPNQVELIKQRDLLGIYNVRPGITGLSQLRKIDMSTPELLAKSDAEMMDTMNKMKYFKYLVLTFIGKGGGDRVRKD